MEQETKIPVEVTATPAKEVPVTVEAEPAVKLDEASAGVDQAIEADRMALDTVMEEKNVPFIDRLSAKSGEPEELKKAVADDISELTKMIGRYVLEGNLPGIKSLTSVKETVDAIQLLSLPIGAGQKSSAELEGSAEVDARRQYFETLNDKKVDLGLLELCYQAKVDRTEREGGSYVDPWTYHLEVFSSEDEAKQWVRALKDNLPELYQLGILTKTLELGSHQELGTKLLLTALTLRLGLNQPRPYDFEKTAKFIVSNTVG